MDAEEEKNIAEALLEVAGELKLLRDVLDQKLTHLIVAQPSGGR